jgi:hypothetical protein
MIIDHSADVRKTATPKQPEKVIRMVTPYMVDGLGKINAFMAIEADVAKAAGQPVEIFRGSTVIGLPGPGGQMIQVPLDFEIDAVGIKQAFDKFEEAAKSQFEKNMEEAQSEAEAERNKIVTAPEAALHAINQRPPFNPRGIIE